MRLEEPPAAGCPEGAAADRTGQQGGWGSRGLSHIALTPWRVGAGQFWLLPSLDLRPGVAHSHVRSPALPARLLTATDR